jgi:hypothetical protein
VQLVVFASETGFVEPVVARCDEPAGRQVATGRPVPPSESGLWDQRWATPEATAGERCAQRCGRERICVATYTAARPTSP